ncbi:MAG: hypothetical protein OEU54_05320 [Gemmatimonadota bacterium]|nr:hypothetical protein [Gemmatimonadota bacterium]
MQTFVATAVAFMLATLALGLGTLLGRAGLAGSCGGVGACQCGRGDGLCSGSEEGDSGSGDDR